MKDIIAPVERQLLKQELRDEYLLRPTNKAGNLIYDIDYHTSPNLMREIARLREYSFREGGGSTGEEMDWDEYDRMEKPYRQLIVWDPEHEQIVGGYRYILGADVAYRADGQPLITSNHLFHYTDYFIQDYLPHTMDLGRAFVQPMYQSREMGAKSIFALDNLWDGLGAIVAEHKEIQYLIGKVTIYPAFDPVSRDLLYAYLHHFRQSEKMLFYPIRPVEISAEAQRLAGALFAEGDSESNYHVLQHAIRERGCFIPPMFSAYLNLTKTLQYFGTAINDEMGDVYETGIMVKVAEVNEDKWERYVGTYLKHKQSIEIQ